MTEESFLSLFFFISNTFLQFFSQHVLEAAFIHERKMLQGICLWHNVRCHVSARKTKLRLEEALHVIPSEFLLSAHSTPLHKNDKAQDYA